MLIENKVIVKYGFLYPSGQTDMFDCKHGAFNTCGAAIDSGTSGLAIPAAIEERLVVHREVLTMAAGGGGAMRLHRREMTGCTSTGVCLQPATAITKDAIDVKR